MPIALIEILGASWSFIVAVHLLLGRRELIIASWLFIVLAFSWFTLVGIAGVRLLRDQRGGWMLSLVAQCAQLVQLTVGGVAFRLLAGLHLTVFYLGDGFYSYGGVTSSVNLFRGASDPPMAIGINLVAALLLTFLAMRPAGLSAAHAA